jgi:hypothetical protein
MLQEVESGTNFSTGIFFDIKAEIDLLYPIVASDYVNHAAATLFPHNGQDGERDNARQSNLAFMHRYKYLIYASAPNDDGNPLVDPSGLNEPLALPVTDGPDEVGEYDLTGVSWLTPGMFYWVRNVMWAIEIEKDDFIYG